MYAILPNDIWFKPAIVTCFELANIPRELAKITDACVVYEVAFSHESYIVYEKDSLHADKCYLDNPLSIHAFLNKHNLWQDALRYSGLSIQYFKGEKPVELCMEAVKQTGMALQYIESPYQTEEMCLYAVNNDWQSLQYVKNQTHEICKTAIERSGKAIQHVKEPTPELCCAALENDGGFVCIQSFPPDVCLMAVQKNSGFFQYIPAEKQSREVCEVAIYKDPHMLQYMHNQTHDLCLRAVKKDGLALQHVKVQTPELCMAALENTANALSHVKEYMLGKVCAYAKEHNIAAIYFQKEDHINDAWWNGTIYGATFTLGMMLVIQKCLSR